MSPGPPQSLHTRTPAAPPAGTPRAASAAVAAGPPTVSPRLRPPRPARADVLPEGHYLGALRPSPGVLEDVAPDRQEPGAKPALAPEPAHGAEGSNERLLHQIVEVRLGRARAGEKTCQRTGVATDQFGRGLLVTALPGGNQRRIGRNRGDGLGLRHGAPEGGRGNDANIKWWRLWRLWRLWRSVQPFPTSTILHNLRDLHHP